MKLKVHGINQVNNLLQCYDGFDSWVDCVELNCTVTTGHLTEGSSQWIFPIQNSLNNFCGGKFLRIHILDCHTRIVACHYNSNSMHTWILCFYQVYTLSEVMRLTYWMNITIKKSNSKSNYHVARTFTLFFLAVINIKNFYNRYTSSTGFTWMTVSPQNNYHRMSANLKELKGWTNC